MNKYEKIKELIRQPWISLFMDGRNEHGTHLIRMMPNGFSEDEYSIDDMLDSQSEDVERVFKQAEKAGYKAGCCIVVICRVEREDFDYCYEITDLCEELTELMHGGAVEQLSKLAEAMAAELSKDTYSIN